MKDVRLTKNEAGYYDLKITNGRAEFIEDGSQVAQHGSIRLQKFIDESVVGDSLEDYTKWYEVIFDVQKSRAEKEFELKRRILETPGAESMILLNWEQSGRVLTINASVKTIFGAASISQEIEPL